MSTDEPGRIPPAWPVTAREERLVTPIFRIVQHTCASPYTGAAHARYVIEAPDWVNVVALTDDERVVLVRQYRHATQEVTLEIPGGMVDAEDPDPAHAARRELREETGYEARELTLLGSIAPNPAIQSNLCHTFVATGLHRSGPPAPHGDEDISVVELPLDEIPDRVRRGEISHALVVVGFCWWWLSRRQGQASP